MAQPFLHFGDVAFMGESRGGSRRPHRMHTGGRDLDVQAPRLSVLSDDVSMQFALSDGSSSPVRLFRTGRNSGPSLLLLWAAISK